MVPRGREIHCNMKTPICTGCKLDACGQDFVSIEGLGRFGIMIVGDYSRDAEARESLPLRPHSRGGMIFERTLRRLGYSREQFYVTQAVRCRPWDPIEGLGGLESDVLSACQPHLLADLKRLKPRVLIALGNTALRALTGWTGKKRGVHHVRGYVLRALPELCEAAGNPDLMVIPTYDPNHIRNGNTHLIGVFARDIQRAVNIRAGKDQSFILDLPPMPPEGTEADSFDMENMKVWLAQNGFRYTLHPTLQEVDAFCRDVKERSDAWLALTPDERDHSPIALSHDIETFESADLDEDESDGFSDTKLSLSQFTIEPGQAIAMPWTEPYISATRWLLKLPLPKVGQNYWYFDRRVMRAVGKRDFANDLNLLTNGPLYDTLQQFHYMEPDLPAHLQYAASYVQFPVIWKHLAGDNLEAYGCFDTDSALRIFLMTRRTMQDRGIWRDAVPGRASTGYINMVQVVRPILEKMEIRGLPINDERRRQLGAEFSKVRDEIYLELDRRFPEAARKLTPKEKGVVTGYAGMPAAVKQILEEIQPTAVPVFTDVALPALVNKKTGEIGPERIGYVDATGAKVTKKFVEQTRKDAMNVRWNNITEDEMRIIRCTPFFEPSDEVDDDTGEAIPGDKFFYDRRLVGRQEIAGMLSPGKLAWVRVYQFSPNSGAQLMAYMTEKGHEIPYDKKKKKTSTGKKGLERLAVKTGDDFYTKTISCREMDKMGSTYVDGFKPNPETGRVHTTFTFATATGQLSSRAPNCQNYPAHGHLGKAVKSMIEAPEGYEIANWDFKSFHVLMTGLLAEDPAYMRMARLDMHSFITWNFLQLPDAQRLLEFTDGELLEKFAWLKKNEDWKRIRDKQAKPSILGIALGLMPPTLYEMNLEHFENLKRAEQFRNLIQRLFPKVFRMQTATAQEAHDNGVLMNSFGMLRRFYEVLQPDGKGGWKPGDQYNAAIALRVQSNSHGELREKIKQLDESGAAEEFGLNNTIHDSIQLCYPIEKRQAMVRAVGPVLTGPSRVLVHPTLAPGGLTLGVECEVGKNMADKKQIDWENLL